LPHGTRGRLPHGALDGFTEEAEPARPLPPPRLAGTRRITNTAVFHFGRANGRARPETFSTTPYQENTMLYYAIVFLIIALVAGFFGFFGVAGLAASIAKILFVIFIILFIASLIFGRRRRL
jgi:uncharacterized membrane protein YtjA (UPF0391 family)